MFDVIKICLIFLSFSNFSINGTTLRISPTLAPWNHTRLPFIFFFEKKQNFSLNLLGSSFFFIIRNNIIKGEIDIINEITI